MAEITWEEIYEVWKINLMGAPEILTRPLEFKTITVDYPKGIFYGYDWLSRAQAEKRESIIQKNISQFLYFTQPTNKGIIHTLQMLAEAQDSEETAAIWLYAIAHDLINISPGRNTVKYLYNICTAAEGFLHKRFYTWHHAMRRLVPQIYTQYSFFENAQFNSIEPLISLISINAALICHEYVPILYSSLPVGETPPDYSVRLG